MFIALVPRPLLFAPSGAECTGSFALNKRPSRGRPIMACLAYQERAMLNDN